MPLPALDYEKIARDLASLTDRYVACRRRILHFLISCGAGHSCISFGYHRVGHLCTFSASYSYISSGFISYTIPLLTCVASSISFLDVPDFHLLWHLCISSANDVYTISALFCACSSLSSAGIRRCSYKHCASVW